LSGAVGSTGVVVVRGADGVARTVHVKRSAAGTGSPQREGEVVRVLPRNIGYADLERLEVADVPAMFERLRDTAGIIFDMRGYPRGTAWAIAPRLNTRKPPFVAIFERPVMTAGSTTERAMFTQAIPSGSGWIYTKPTAMLIDERAISQSEHTGLFLKGANGTVFVGSATSGANGDVTTTTLPGGLRVSFTGQDVRWADGHQLQRVGLVPDVMVKPTLAGIRAGRDEVLDRAVETLAKAGGRQ
jgi:C-terminal processing protease CtpA/Prc